MSEPPRIHSWPCSYYLNSSKQWIPGRLSLTPLSIQFTSDTSRELLLDFQLQGISEIKKESSHLIFSSLTVLEGGTKHWFSSLRPSRNVVFNVLEHFWREQLLSGRDGAALGSPRGRELTGVLEGSHKGRELTGVLEGSQRRLQDTAQVLHAQGEQFDNIIRGLNKIQGDMDVADRLLTELESPSWWPFSTKLWKTPQDSKPKETPPAAPNPKPEEETLLRIPVIITQGPDSNSKPGKLTLLPSGLEIWDCNSHLVHRFESREVDEIRVHSPYEISVRQRFIGKPDTSYRLLAARMPQLIPLLQLRFSRKIQFLEDALGFAGAAAGSPAEGLGSSVWRAASGFLGAAANPEFPTGDGTDKEQLQVQKISQDEVNELRQILRKLKGLALETEAELERQDEALDSIGSSVDRATLNVERQNRRMRRLT